jgi:hypothetical protein
MRRLRPPAVAGVDLAYEEAVRIHCAAYRAAEEGRRIKL